MVMMALDGTFYFPPRFDTATLSEFVDFWMNVPVPDDALARFCSEHVATRNEFFHNQDVDPVADAGYPDHIPVQWARDYARIARASMFVDDLPGSDRVAFRHMRVNVDYSDAGDTISGLLSRYRLAGTRNALQHPEMPGNPHPGFIVDLLERVVSLLDRVDDGVAGVDRTLDMIKDSVESLG